MSKISDEIQCLEVGGFKSIRDSVRLCIHPLTVLAGANSSGKSSIMQPLLLLKQTLEAKIEYRILNLDGPNVSFSSWGQIFTQGIEPQFSFGITGKNIEYSRTIFTQNKEVRVSSPVISNGEQMPLVSDVIHVPGLRGDPRRTYPDTVTGPKFFGRFTNVYAANILAEWAHKTSENAALIGQQMSALGLTSKVDTKRVGDAHVEIRVGRTVAGENSPSDMVNIADVGIGISQALPVLTALLSANPGQMVYIEQPEIHLHPRAQLALSAVLIRAANRGVKVVIETHSAILLRGILTGVASGEISAESTALYWFQRDGDGCTSVKRSELDVDGAFGDSPVDFYDVEMAAEEAYILAACTKLVQK